MEMIFMNTKTVKQINHKNIFFVCILDLRSSNEHVALQLLSIYYTWRI